MAKIIIALLICMFSISSISCDAAYICGGMSLKASDVCAFEEEGEKLNILHIYDDCSKDEKCRKEGDGHYYCTKVTKRREIDESCNYDADCVSGKCSSNKCSGKGDGKECDFDNECENGYSCALVSGKNQCTKLLKSGATCTGTSAKCGYALTCYDGKCVKWGSISNGNKANDPKLCESGRLNQADKTCYEIKDHYDCEEHPEVSTTDISIKPSGTKKISCDQSEIPGPDGKFRRVPSESPYQTTAFKEFIKELEKVKPYDDLYDKKPNYFSRVFANNEIKQKYAVYENAIELMKMGLIDKDGKILNKCEYRFYMKHKLSSKYLNIKNLLIILGLFLI